MPALELQTKFQQQPQARNIRDSKRKPRAWMLDSATGQAANTSPKHPSKNRGGVVGGNLSF